MSSQRTPERINTVIVGGGQSGLSVGYFLKQRGIPFVILESNERIGDSWRHRWDSLRLFTPARYNGIVGMPFPAPPHYYPTKDEMADYLESYAAEMQLPVRTGVRVDRLWKEGGRYLISAGDTLLEAEHVVIAMATYQKPRIPAFAASLSPDIVQVHSRDYHNASQLREGGVLVVGAGNSGAEIAYELAREGRETWLSGRDVGHVPFEVEGTLANRVIVPVLFRLIFHRLLTVDTPIGRKARPTIISRGGPLIRRKPKDLDAAGVHRVPRTRGANGGQPVLADGRALDVANVIWCTGFDAGLEWIELPIFDAVGEPVHERGLVPSEPGISFVGQHFLYAMSSTMIHGVARDAERIANAIAPARQPARSTSARREVAAAAR